jgi:hypothetical protein
MDWIACRTRDAVGMQPGDLTGFVGNRDCLSPCMGLLNRIGCGLAETRLDLGCHLVNGW